MQREIKGIVRIAGKDVKGQLSLVRALMHVRGVGHTLANAIGTVAAEQLHIDRSTQIGALNEEELSKIEEIIKHPVKFGIPFYLVNRQRDSESGEHRHLVGNDLLFAVKQDINKDINLRTWRGFRHATGQKVRGQRTRTSGRTGMTMGVIRKKMLPGSAPASGAKPEEKASEKKK